MPEPVASESLFLRLLAIQNTSDARKCWPWPGALDDKGYGRATASGPRAHRWAYIVLKAPIPEGLEIHHTCENRACINPAHMQLLTHSEHIRRGMHGRPRPRSTVCRFGHGLDGVRPDGRRYCRRCNREREAARRARWQAEVASRPTGRRTQGQARGPVTG